MPSAALNLVFAFSLDPLHWLAKGLASTVSGFALSFIAPWVLDGTKAALDQVASLINGATSPNVRSAWFSAEYWRVAGLATLLTLPFLFAAALQALMRSEPALILKALFGYLPLALLGVSIAAPMVMLLLSATDEMCALVSGTAVSGGARFLEQAAIASGGITALDGSPFLAVVVGIFTLAAALLLAVELLIREAAVYIVVLMLPLAFAALVWPARRVWTTRLIELLISLILSKFVIVSVLSLAGAAYTGGHGAAPLLTAMSLVILSVFAPWALMRLLPFTEVAASAAGGMHQDVIHGTQQARSLRSAGQGGGSAGGPPTSDAGEGADGLGGDDAAVTLPQRLRGYMQGAGSGAGAGAGGAGGSGGEGSPDDYGGRIFDGYADLTSGNSGVSAGGSSDPGAGTATAATGANRTVPAQAAGAGATTGTGSGVLGDGAGGGGGGRGGAGGGGGGQMDPALDADDWAWPGLRLEPGGWGGPVDYRERSGAGSGPALSAESDSEPESSSITGPPLQSSEIFAPEPPLPSGEESPWRPEGQE